jgi:pyruvate-ferredoxin/flavodoxin oxidoreductase
MTVPVTVADWAATEGRFRKHFRPLREGADGELVAFADFVALSEAEREGKKPFLHALGPDRKLQRLEVAPEIVRLAEERQRFWTQLRQMAGRDAAGLKERFEREAAALRQEYETKRKDLEARYPRVLARRLAEGLLKAGGQRTVAELVREAEALPAIEPLAAAPEAGAPAPPPVEAAPAALAVAAAEEPLAIEAYVESARCTACNECTNLNNRIFKYNEKKQAYVADPKGGPFRDLVRAAERCPVRIIHPGTPLDPAEKDLAKWVKRAEPFR